MMSALSDVFERSSQERSSADRRRSGESKETSSSDHGFELQEVRIVESPLDAEGVPPAQRDGEMAEQTRRALFRDYRDRLERSQRPDRGPAASSSAARSAFASVSGPEISPAPRDSDELRRSGHLKSALRPSMEQSMTSAASIPTGEDPGAFVVQQTLAKAAEQNAGRKSFQAPRLGGSLGMRNSSIPQRVRISLDKSAGGGAVESVGATLVRKRRRLPWKALLVFGIVSCCALVVGLTTLAVGIYNLTKLRAARAARTVEQLRNEIEPQIIEILTILRNMTRR